MKSLHFPCIVILAANNKISHNVDGVLYNIGRMIGDSFELHLISGAKRLSERLNSLYKIHKCQIHGPDPGSLRYALHAAHFACKHLKPDIIMNIIDPYSLGLASAFMGRLYNIHSVVRKTGDTFGEFHNYPNLMQKIKKYILYNLLGRLAFRLAGNIIVLGKKFKLEMIEEGYPPVKLTVLPQPFDIKPFSSSEVDKSELKNKLGLCKDKKIILFVGRISYLKGADRLYEIIKRVFQIKKNNLQFCLVGEGEYKNKFNIFSKEQMFLAGAVPHQYISDFYKASDLLVFPSRAEGLPNTILEALAARLPIAATPVGEIPNYVENTFTEVDQFVDYIVAEKWDIDPIPEWFDWEKQVTSYKKFFNKIIEDARTKKNHNRILR